MGTVCKMGCMDLTKGNSGEEIEMAVIHTQTLIAVDYIAA